MAAEHVSAKNTGKEKTAVHITVYVTKNVLRTNVMAQLLETVTYV